MQGTWVQLWFGRSHKLQGSKPVRHNSWSLCSRTRKSQLLKLRTPKSPCSSTSRATTMRSQHTTTRESPLAAMKTQLCQKQYLRKENALAYIYQNPTYPSPFLTLIMYGFVLSTSYGMVVQIDSITKFFFR